MKIHRIGVLSIKIPNLFDVVSVALPEYEFVNLNPTCDNQELQTLDVVLADFELIGPHLYDIPHVKFVQGTSPDIQDLLKFVKRNELPPIPILRYSGPRYAKLVAEFVIASIIIQERDLYRAHKNQMLKFWVTDGRIGEYRPIDDLLIGVMGLGEVGRVIVKLLHNLGAVIRAFNEKKLKHDDETNKFIANTFSTNHLTSFLEGCDYVICTLPSTKETEGLLNGDAFSRCEDTVFINVGTGDVIADNDLMRALDLKWLSHACLDTFNQPQLPKGHAFWTMPNVTITPNVSGCIRPADIADQLGDTLDDFGKHRATKDLPNIIDFEKGY